MRSKPRASERKNPAQENATYCSMEVELALSGLKDTNSELVKRVAKLELDLRDLRQEKFTWERKYIELKQQYNCAKRTMPEIEELMKSCTPMFICALERVMKAIDLCKAIGFKRDQGSIGSSSNDLKTRAVQPHAVNGTVSCNPRVSLKRLSEDSLNRITSDPNDISDNISNDRSEHVNGVNERLSKMKNRRITELNEMASRHSTGQINGTTNRASSRNRDETEDDGSSVENVRCGRASAPVIETVQPEEKEEEDDIDDTVAPEESIEVFSKLSVILEESAIGSPPREIDQLNVTRTSSVEAESDDRTFQAIDSFLESPAIVSDMNVLRKLRTNTDDTVPSPRVFSPQTNSTRVELSQVTSDLSSRAEHWPSNFLDSIRNGSCVTEGSSGTLLNTSGRSHNKTAASLNVSTDDESNDIWTASDLGDRDNNTKVSILQGLGLEPANSIKLLTPTRVSPITRLTTRKRNLRVQLVSLTDGVQEENTTPNPNPAPNDPSTRLTRKAECAKELVVLLERNPEVEPSPKKPRKSSIESDSSTPVVKKKKFKKRKKSVGKVVNKTEDTIKDIKRRLSDYMPGTPKKEDPSPLKINQGRPKRAARPVNLKDSSLKKKMRR